MTSMAVTVLRSRAVCTGCESRLPPRTEVWWDDAAASATCLSCARMEGLLESPSIPIELVEGAAEAVPAVPEADDDVVRPLVGRGSGLKVVPVASAARPPLPPREKVTQLHAVRSGAHDVPDARGFSSEGATAIDRVEADDEDESVVEDSAEARHVQSATGLIGRLRTATHEPLHTGHGESLVVERPEAGIDRGPIGDDRVTRTLEAARIHGVEVFHRRTITGVAVDHLVVAVTGIWVVVGIESLTGRLSKRDLGDWFNADARLFIGEDDRTNLLVSAREQAEAVRVMLSEAGTPTVPVRPVVCFGNVPPAWVCDPFVVGEVSVTWRNHLVEPMLDPVMIGRQERDELVRVVVAASAG